MKTLRNLEKCIFPPYPQAIKDGMNTGTSSKLCSYTWNDKVSLFDNRKESSTYKNLLKYL